MPFIGHPKTPPKKSREFPLGDPSPCGKTGLASCRQCTFSIFLHSFFGYLFLFVFYVYITFYVFPSFSVHFFPVPFIGLPITSQNAIKKIQKSKIQTPDQKASKRVCPTRVCPTREPCSKPFHHLNAISRPYAFTLRNPYATTTGAYAGDYGQHNLTRRLRDGVSCRKMTPDCSASLRIPMSQGRYIQMCFFCPGICLKASLVTGFGVRG